jgi:TonB family protein
MRMPAILILAVLLLGGCSLNRGAAPKPMPPSQDEEKGAEAYFPHRKDLFVFPKRIRMGDPIPTIPQRVGAEIPQPAPSEVPPGDYRIELAYIVESDGVVREAIVVSSSGVEALDKACIERIKKSRYKPAELDGKKSPAALLETARYSISRF